MLPAVLAAKNAGWQRVVVPDSTLAEAGLVDGIDIFGAGSLRDVLAWLRGEVVLLGPGRRSRNVVVASGNVGFGRDSLARGRGAEPGGRLGGLGRVVRGAG